MSIGSFTQIDPSEVGKCICCGKCAEYSLCAESDQSAAQTAYLVANLSDSFPGTMKPHSTSQICYEYVQDIPCEDIPVGATVYKHANVDLKDNCQVDECAHKVCVYTWECEYDRETSPPDVSGWGDVTFIAKSCSPPPPTQIGDDPYPWTSYDTDPPNCKYRKVTIGDKCESETDCSDTPTAPEKPDFIPDPCIPGNSCDACDTCGSVWGKTFNLTVSRTVTNEGVDYKLEFVGSVTFSPEHWSEDYGAYLGNGKITSYTDGHKDWEHDSHLVGDCGSTTGLLWLYSDTGGGQHICGSNTWGWWFLDADLCIPPPIGYITATGSCSSLSATHSCDFQEPPNPIVTALGEITITAT